MEISGWSSPACVLLVPLSRHLQAMRRDAGDRTNQKAVTDAALNDVLGCEEKGNATTIATKRKDDKVQCSRAGWGCLKSSLTIISCMRTNSSETRLYKMILKERRGQGGLRIRTPRRNLKI